MVQQINLLRPGRETGQQGQRIWLWGLPPLLLGLALPLGLWHWQQEQIEQATAAQRQLEQQLQARRAELVPTRSQPPSAADLETRRQREQLLTTLRSRAEALGHQEGFRAAFELLSSLASEGVWLTSVEIGRSEAGISVAGQATDPARAMKHIQLLQLRLGAMGYRPRGYEISNPNGPGDATTFRIY